MKRLLLDAEHGKFANREPLQNVRFIGFLQLEYLELQDVQSIEDVTELHQSLK